MGSFNIKSSFGDDSITFKEKADTSVFRVSITNITSVDTFSKFPHPIKVKEKKKQRSAKSWDIKH